MPDADGLLVRDLCLVFMRANEADAIEDWIDSDDLRGVSAVLDRLIELGWRSPPRPAVADDETQAGRPSYEELEDQVRELEDAAADHSERLLDLRRLDETRHERNVLRDQLTTVHVRPRPRTGWPCTCPHGPLDHDGDGTCQSTGCPCPESLVEIRDSRDAALRAPAETAAETAAVVHEWRVTGQPDGDYPHYENTYRDEPGGPATAEETARTFITRATDSWTDVALHHRTVTYTAWEPES